MAEKEANKFDLFLEADFAKETRQRLDMSEIFDQ